MSRRRWGGSEARAARALLAPQLPAPCCRCGTPVLPRPWLPGDGWQPDHWPVPREFGGTEVHPVHTECNLSAGDRRGAQITNARRRARTRPAPTPAGRDPRDLNMRGI